MDTNFQYGLPAEPACALHEFEAALSTRTQVSDGQAERLRALPLGDLDREARAGAEIIKRLGDAVSAAMREPERATSFLETLDLRIVTRDHDWRAIFGALREQAGGDSQHMRVALWNYLAYLCSRRDLIEQVLEQRRALECTDEHPALELDPQPLASGLVRLPKGETVIVKLPYRGQLTLYLGRHAFTLADGYPPRLVDPEGGWQKLERGSQLVGRHPACELVTWPDFGDVSRAHLELDWRGDSHVAITDRSSRGTFVDVDALADGPVSGPCRPASAPCAPDAIPDDGEQVTVVRRSSPERMAATRFVRGD